MEASGGMTGDTGCDRYAYNLRLADRCSSACHIQQVMYTAHDRRNIGPKGRQVLENHLTERHARALLRMEDPEKRMAALKTVIERKMNVAQTDTYIKSLLEQEGQAKRPKRTFIAKDVRLFLNTIDHAVQTMKEAGIGAAFQRKETDEYYECVVRIPKSAAHKAS